MKQITVNDKMQQGYVYVLEAKQGTGFVAQLTPKEMLSLGVFEGHYLNDCRYEFPADWFDCARLSLEKPDVTCNFFREKSRQSLSFWQKKGWIYGPDPRGWFQWYCRYYSGRRLSGIDEIQIARWKSFSRHAGQIKKHCIAEDVSCRIKQRQALLQWGYNPFI